MLKRMLTKINTYYFNRSYNISIIKHLSHYVIQIIPLINCGHYHTGSSYVKCMYVGGNEISDKNVHEPDVINDATGGKYKAVAICIR